MSWKILLMLAEESMVHLRLCTKSSIYVHTYINTDYNYYMYVTHPYLFPTGEDFMTKKLLTSLNIQS